VSVSSSIAKVSWNRIKLKLESAFNTLKRWNINLLLLLVRMSLKSIKVNLLTYFYLLLLLIIIITFSQKVKV